MAKLFLGLVLIYHLVALLFLLTLFPPLTLPFVRVFHKDQSLVLSYSYSILLLLVLLSLIRLSVIIYLLMTLNCSSPSGHLDFSTARTIATSLIHSKLDHCNSLFLNLLQSQLGRLQLILNFSARAVSKTPKFVHITPVLKSLHLLKIEQRLQYKVASITYKVLQSEQPSYLHSLLNVQSNRTTRSSDIITLQRPSVRSRLKVTDRSFTHHAPVLWNSLPKQLRQPSAPLSLVTATDSTPPLALSSHQFHSKLKTFLFEQSFLP